MVGLDTRYQFMIEWDAKDWYIRCPCMVWLDNRYQCMVGLDTIVGYGIAG